MKKNASTIILIIVFFVGLSLLLYPIVSDYWNSFHQSRTIATYADTVLKLDRKVYDDILSQAVSYNKSLLGRENPYNLNQTQLAQYPQMLDVGGTGIMGYIEIPSINCHLPIYHGTSDSVLQVGIGHLDWTALPVGGRSTHCVLSGHRGLPSAKIFTDLDKLGEGDYFIIRVLDEILTYEVDKISIVEPQDTDSLQVQKGKDLVTLVTCTPYGINSHRLLVRGHRVENTPSSRGIRVTADATQIEPVLVAPFLAIPMILLLLLLFFI